MESTIYTVNGQEFELQHYGVKGMKWGVRQARQKSRELNRKRSAYVRAKRDETASADEVRAARNEYKLAKKEWDYNAPTQAKLERGAVKTTKALAAVGMLYATDKVFFKGTGTKIAKGAAKTALKGVGMLTLSAVAKARGRTNIHWYTATGRKII